MSTSVLFSSPVEQHTVELINERLETWTITLNSTIEYFTEIARCEHALGKAHKKLAASLINSVTGSTSGSSSATSSPRPESRTSTTIDPLECAYSLQTSVGSESISQYAKEETLVRLEGLREDFQARSKEIKDRLYRVQRSMGREQEGLVRAMKEHERVWVEQLESTAAQAFNEAGTGERKDPFLTELHLHSQIEGFVGEKDKLCSELSSLFSETRVLNADCARRLSACISEHFTVKAKHRLAQMEQMKDVSRGIEAVEAEAEWLHALIRSRLDYDWALGAPPIDGFSQSVLNQISSEIVASVSRPATSSKTGSPLARAPSASLMVKPVRIVKSGFLMRPGSTFGPSWLVLFFVLTDSNFLHAYSPESKRRSGAAKSYAIPSADDQLSKKHLADLNQAISAALLGYFLPGAESTSVDARLLSPLFSISLATAGVSVAVESPNEHVWSVTVPGGASNFFGRGDKKYTLKSFLEEDMVDWCIALKDAIAAAQAATTAFHHHHHPPPNPTTTASAVAHPTWTAEEEGDYLVEQPVDEYPYSSHAFESAAEEEPPALPQVTSVLAGFSFHSDNSRSSSSAKSATPTFSLENPWDQ